MKTEQLSVFLENRAGRLAEVIHALAEAGINIRALSLADTSDFGILRMIVSHKEKARELLKEKGFNLGSVMVLAVEAPDQQGGLDTVLQLMSGGGINVEYMYAFVRREHGNAIMIFRFDKLDEALEILTGHGLTVIPEERLCSC